MRNNFSVHQKSIQPVLMNQSMNVPRDELRASQFQQGNNSGLFRVQQPQISQQYRVIPQQKVIIENPNFVQNNQGFIRAQAQQSVQNKDLQNVQYLQQLLLQRENQIQQLNQSLSQIALKFNEVHEQIKGQQKKQNCNKCSDFDQLQFQIQQERIIHQEKLNQNAQEIQKLKQIIQNQELDVEDLRQKNDEIYQQVQEIASRKSSQDELQIQLLRQQNIIDNIQDNFQNLNIQDNNVQQ